MPTRDARRKIAPGIYEDATQRYATVHVRGGGFREKRFPLEVDLSKIEAWRQTERVKLLQTAQRGTAAGTFNRDAVRYLRDFTQHLTSKLDRKYEIKRWQDEFGEQPRGIITTADIARVRARWLAEGKAPKTINNRVNTLRHLYHCLDGKKAWTPCDDLEPLHVHKSPMQFVPDAVIAAVDLKLQELEQQKVILSNKTRARFRVLVSTGRRPSEVMRAQPGDVNMQRRIWIPRDGKGGESPGIYLNDDMLAAWQFFIDANAWGQYDTFLQAERLRRAGWPAHIKPYNARHTVGITLSERGVDLKDVGDMMGHKRSETTRKHYVPVLNSRMQKASEALEGRFAGWPQTGVQTTKSRNDKKRPNLKQSKRRPTTGKSARKR